MRRIQFTKYDAAGNTFLVVDRSTANVDRRLLGRIAQRLCDPVAGVGADGLLILRSARHADFALDIFNADGSWAERSGNGLRAAVAHASRKSPRKTNWTIACQRERVEAKIISRSAKQSVIQSQVGFPQFSKPSYDGALLKISQLPALVVAGKPYPYVRLSIGNPHLVLVVRAISRNWIDIARAVSIRTRIRGGMNIEFVRSRGPAQIEMRVFERGVGATESSGTGAAAALAALSSLGKVNMRVEVDFGSERLSAAWMGPGEMISVTGPVKMCFTGEAAL